MESWLVPLKEYSLILIISFMAWIRRYKRKKLISKISVNTNFMFSSYAWLCVFHCSHRLLCWIKSRVRDFLWKLLSFHTEMISALFLWGSVLLREKLRKYAKKNQILKIFRVPFIRPLWVANRDKCQMEKESVILFLGRGPPCLQQKRPNHFVEMFRVIIRQCGQCSWSNLTSILTTNSSS